MCLPCVRNDDGAFGDEHSVVNVIGDRFMRYTWKVIMSMVRHEREYEFPNQAEQLASI